MAKPRIFVSSTYYDLKHIRSSMELFIEGLGFEAILSEKGDIAYVSDRALDESCYREAAAADIFVLIIGGRYGSEVSGATRKTSPAFFERYDSVTKKEFDTAYSHDIPVYIIMEAGVNSEYQTYLRNKDNEQIRYAHVDSVNVFKLIEEILAKPRNNPVFTFERFSQIEVWLRDQWSGFFRELLKTRTQQKQLLALTAQVGELKAVNETLKTYLEAVMVGMGKDDSTKLIESEEKRLEESKRRERARSNQWCQYAANTLDYSVDEVITALEKCSSGPDFVALLAGDSHHSEAKIGVLDTLQRMPAARRDFNSARRIFGLSAIKDWGEPIVEDEEETVLDDEDQNNARDMSAGTRSAAPAGRHTSKKLRMRS